ncbi:amino acid adenylation domain-containing protein [Natronosporangium hydrolyticum]|uniref:Phenyloxazoline synthase MbtB n=1 Tax=Natronosporangium hydrolyticum TaxID=2811111 RepID=A0A895YCR9_9ACTN|nr:amino acid adenylation domain-containing protein [Natronosporangium hydrolyticum]QSB13982.1 amino acid adenylation domain-containing protein [Natronosporangium hydrolyticum]
MPLRLWPGDVMRAESSPRFAILLLGARAYEWLLASIEGMRKDSMSDVSVGLADIDDTLLTKPSEAFPLTDLQHAYVFGRRPGLELSGVASHVYLEFHGPRLDLDRLADALHRLTTQHEMLRAVLTPDGQQRVLPPPSRRREIPVEDLTGQAGSGRRNALARVRAELSQQQPPADQAEPLQVRVSLLGAGEQRLHLRVDLLFLDLPSVLRLLVQWRRGYDQPEWTPPAVAASFRDYPAALTRLRASAAGDRDAAYWQDRLPQLPAAPELPLAVAPEQLGTPSFEHHRVTLDAARWASLAGYARRRQLDPSTVLLAAYAEVLRTWSKTEQFTVIVTSNARQPTHPQIGEVVGEFTTPQLLAVTGRAGQSFAERAADLADQLETDRGHGTVSGIEVMRELARQNGGRAAMPVVFSSTVGAAESAGGDPLASFGEPLHIATATPQVWLENQLWERAGELIVAWHAVEGLFPPGLVADLLAAYQRLLSRLADDEASWELGGGLAGLPPAHAVEQQAANATDEPLPAVRLHDLVAAAAQRRPDAVAVITEAGEFSYRWLTEQAHRLARRLRECCDPRPGTLVAVSMPAGAEQLAAILGVLHSGAAYVAIDPTLPEQRRHALLQRCRVPAVVTDEALREELSWPAGVTVVTGADEATRRCDPAPVTSPQRPDDLAYVIFTSGSTGEPKGVMITHQMAGNTIQDINQRYAVAATDRVLALAPTGFDLSVFDIFGVLGAGGAVVVPAAGRASDPTHWTELADRHGVTIWNTVPAPMQMWVDARSEAADAGVAGGSAADRLRLVLLSGDWIPTDLPARIREQFPAAQVISLGGATEGSIWSVAYPIGEVPPEWPSIPYGKPLANQTLHIYDAWLEPCPTWVTGEIYIGGAGVAAGYWDDPERTAERFLTHPVTGARIYRTGDLGRYLPGGDIEILGREDHQVKINGYRVELGEIEAVLARQPGVRQALVTAPAHPHTGQRQLAAYLVMTGGEPDPARLREAVAQLLPQFMVPSHYLAIDELPITRNGKVDKAALPEPWRHDEGGAPERAAPTNTVEQRLLAIWCKQLGHDDIGVRDGFFDVGGDSLHAVGILREVRQEFGIGPDAEQELIEGLFMNTDIADFGELVGTAAVAAS